MIHSVAWYCDSHYGLFNPAGESFTRPSPAGTWDELLGIISRPVKYFSRMTHETRACLAASSLALRTLPADVVASKEIGLVSAGHDGCVTADQNYFRDYVSSGRTMGRGNLFIYTLPTSTLGEVAIALSLSGPSMYLHADRNPLADLIRNAEQLVADGEAGAVLALWTDSQASVCLSITGGTGGVTQTLPEVLPRQLADQFRAKAQPA